MKTMTKLATTLFTAGLMLLTTVGTAGAAADHASHTGRLIHESTIEGYRMAYHLLQLPGRQDHHLIVYITTPGGQPVESAKVGYLVKGPDGSEQKAMAMKMDKNFGADVDFSAPGQYLVKVKAVIGDDKLLDSFSYPSQ